jgi:hypothetical protein
MDTKARHRIVSESRAVGGQTADDRPEDPRAAAAAAAEVCSPFCGSLNKAIPSTARNKNTKC